MFQEDWQRQGSLRQNSREVHDLFQKRVFQNTISKFGGVAGADRRSRAKAPLSQYSSRRSVGASLAHSTEDSPYKPSQTLHPSSGTLAAILRAKSQ